MEAEGAAGRSVITQPNPAARPLPRAEGRETFPFFTMKEEEEKEERVGKVV